MRLLLGSVITHSASNGRSFGKSDALYLDGVMPADLIRLAMSFAAEEFTSHCMLNPTARKDVPGVQSRSYCPGMESPPGN